MRINYLFALALGLAAGAARADFATFDHDVLCQATDTTAAGTSTSVKIVYDRSEFPENGRAGGIHVELNTGVSELSGMGAALGLDKPYGRVLRRSGPAGQVGNSIVQDKSDPFVVEVNLGFTTYDLIGADGKVAQQFSSFISVLDLTRVSERGFHDGDTADVQEFIELRLLDDFGTHHMRFRPSECKVLN